MIFNSILCYGSPILEMLLLEDLKSGFNKEM